MPPVKTFKYHMIELISLPPIPLQIWGRKRKNLYEKTQHLPLDPEWTCYLCWNMSEIEEWAKSWGMQKAMVESVGWCDHGRSYWFFRTNKNMYLGHKPENKRREPSIEEDRGISKESCAKETIEYGGFATAKTRFFFFWEITYKYFY